MSGSGSSSVPKTASSGSVSSLASKFEQLAGSSGNSTAPARPVKPSRLRANSSSLALATSANEIDHDDDATAALATPTATTVTRPRGLSSASNASYKSTAAVTATTEEAAPPPPNAMLAPPSIPFATRPNTSTSGSFSYGSNGGITPPASPLRKSSRSPPPVPPPRGGTSSSVGSAAGSRPNTPSRKDNALGLGLMPPSAEPEDQGSGPVSVASLAAKFGAAPSSRPTTPKAPPSPVRPVSPKPPVPPPRGSNATEVSAALQQVTAATDARPRPIASTNPFDSPTSSPGVERAGQANPFDSPTGSPEAVKSDLGSISGAAAAQNRSPPVIRAPRPIAPRAPIPQLTSAPPTPPPRNVNGAGEASSVGLATSASSPGRTTGALPPTLPARKGSDSALSPMVTPGLLPALPARTGPALPARPRSSTTATSPAAENAIRIKPAMNLSPPARRETVAASKREHIEQEPYLPPPPPVRNIAAGGVDNVRMYVNGSASSIDQPALDVDSDESDVPGGADEDPLEVSRAGRLCDMPDATFANRRPPRITPERTLCAKHTVHAFGVCGRYAITATVHIRLWDTYTGESVGTVQCPGESKVTAAEYMFSDPSALRRSAGQVSRIWAGTKDGGLYEIDLAALGVLDSRGNVHSHPIVGIFRHPGNLVSTVDEAGKVQTWASSDTNSPPSLASNPRTNRMGDKFTYCAAFGTQLWSASGPTRHHHPGAPSATTRSPSIRVYDVAPTANFSLTSRPLFVPENAGAVGAVLSGAAVPAQPNLVYLAHESGHVSIWEKDSLTCTAVVRVSTYAITALEGVVDKLWAGNREGMIQVFDMSTMPWKVVKAWKASDEPIYGLKVDLGSIAELNKLHVASFGRESLTLWDGTLQVDWLERHMQTRDSEFSTFRNIKLLVCSWNIDSCKPADLQGDAVNMNFLSDAIGSSIDTAIADEEPPEIIVFSFQEVVDLENKKLTAKSMLLGKKKADQMFSDQVSHQYTRWHDRLSQAVRTAMPSTAPYSVVHAENLVGLLTLIFVRNSEKPNLCDVAKISVKTGMGGRYGNKGAICARFVLDDSSICFMNCHLAAGQRAKRQRNKDLIDILENKSAFLQPSSAVPGVYIGGNGQTVFEHDICFLSGDLNYRIDLTRSIVQSNIRTNKIGMLLEHDQLLKEMKSNQAFRLRSFREAEIGFLPTYKFDPGTDNYDSSAKERIPAWCDRILWRTSDPASTAVQALQYRSWPATPSDHKPITGLFSVRIKKMQPDKRLKVWQAAEQQWKEREQALLDDAVRYYL